MSTETSLCRVTEDEKKRIWAELSLDKEKIRKSVAEIRKWLEIQPHLPKRDDDKRLECWLIRCKNDMEKVKRTMDYHYTIRSLIPELMAGWRTDQEWFNLACQHTYSIAIPQLTPDLCRIVIVGFLKKDSTGFSLMNHVKLCLMMLEILLCEDYSLKTVIIANMDKMGIEHAKQMTLTTYKKAELCYIGGYINRMKGLHIINSGKLAAFIFGLLKTVLSNKTMERTTVYDQDMSEFQKSVPTYLLPVELGGMNGTIAEHWGKWQKKICSYQNWFQNREEMKSDEIKRPTGKVDADDLFGFDSNFRSLMVD